MAIFQKSFTAATFENAKKYHMSFSQLCQKYNLSEDELEQAVRNVFYKRYAEEMLRIFREQDDKQRKPKSKKTRSNDSEPATTPEAMAAPKLEIVHEEVIEVEEITPDNVGEVMATIQEAISEQPKSKLELLKEKKRTLCESLSIAESELDKLNVIDAEISQNLLDLTNEVRELKNIIEQKISAVGELRDSKAEVKNQIAISKLDVEAINKEILETDEAIQIEQPVTITALSDGWFKFEPEDVEIPNVKVSADELSEVFSQFVLDAQFEHLTRNNIRQLIMLDKMIKSLKNKHPNIDVKFENETMGIAWMSWEQE